MKSHLKSLSKQTVVYGGGLLLKRGIGFFMIPLYTRYLRPEDYGALEILELTGFIVAFFVGFGILQAVYRFHADARDPGEGRRVLTNAVTTVAIVGGLATLCGLAASPWIARATLGTEASSSLVVLLLAGVLFNELMQLVLGYYRVESRPVAYIVYSLASTVLTLSLNLVFLVGMGLGVAGMLLSTLLSSALFALILLGLRIPGGGWKVDPALVRSMLRYCVPFIPMGLMAFTVNFSDRYFLRVFADMETVGVYALAYKLGWVVGFLVGTPVSLVWNPQAFEIARDENAPTTYARVFTYFAVALVGVCTSLSVLAPEVVTLLAAPEYRRAAGVVPILAWSTVFLNATTMLQVGILLKKKTTWLPAIWGGTAAINVLLNLLLIPKMGMAGAACATIAALVYQAGATWIASRRLYPIPYEWRRLGLFAASGLAALALSGLVPADLPVAASAAVKLALLAALGASWIGIPGFLLREERAFLRRMLAGGLPSGFGGRR